MVRADGVGPAAQFSGPNGIAVNSAGLVYVADSGNNTIRKITPTGAVSTLTDANGAVIYAAWIYGVAIDGSDTLFVSAPYQNTISKITLAGVVTPLAGLANTYDDRQGSVDGTGTAARFNQPRGIAIDQAGSCYVTDSKSHTIRKITPGGDVTTLAGLSGGSGAADGPATVARFYTPNGLAADNSGNIYVADSFNNEVRKITPSGQVTTLAGLAGLYYYQGGFVDGTGVDARFFNPRGVAVDTGGTVYVADSGNYSIRKITPTGVVTTLAGSGGWPGGSADGTGTAAKFRNPTGVTVDTAGMVYVADSSNCTIRKITPAGVVTTLAGSAGQSGYADGTGAAAQFLYPSGIAVDPSGTLYVADTFSYTIRKISPAGVVTTFAGTPNVSGHLDGTGTAAQFFSPNSVSLDRTGNIFVTEDAVNNPLSRGNTIRKITPNGVVTTIGGSSDYFGSEDGLGLAATFNSPAGITVDSANNLYISDAGNNAIRKGVLAGPPLITAQPSSQSVAPGGSVQLSVTASGIPAPTYQWFFNGSAFSGATTNTLSFSSARTTDAGDYTVVVTNALGNITSNKATLTVSSTPTTTPGGSGGGGGSISGWFVLALTLLGTARRIGTRENQA